MEFLNISDTKLKVTLSPEECVSYGIDTSKSEFTRAEIKEVMRDILSLAEGECGFVVTSEKILVQLYPMPSGECEIFVTKLGEQAETFPACNLTASARDPEPNPPRSAPWAMATGGMSEGEMALLRRICEEGEEDDMDAKHKESPRSDLSSVHTRRVMVAFQDLEHLLTVCRRLLRDEYRGRSDVYIAETGGHTDWSLILEVPDVTVYRLPRRFAFLTEYGQEVTETGLTAYLDEHGRAICVENGVETLGRV